MESATSSDEKNTWVYAIVILVLVSLWMLSMRLSNNPFLALDFEIIVVYLPTIVTGMITAYTIARSKRTS